MLPRLLLRDWILNRRAVCAVLAIAAAFEVYVVMKLPSPRLFLVACCVLASFNTISPFTRDDKFRSAEWSCALPVTRRDLVRARYAGAWIFVLVSVAVAVALAAWMPGSVIPMSGLSDPAGLLLAAALATIILAVLIPFVLRFGITGVMIAMVVFQILGVLALFAVMAASARGPGGRGGLRAAIATTGDLFGAMQAALTPPGFYLAVIVALSLVNWAGYRLALALFSRKEF